MKKLISAVTVLMLLLGLTTTVGAISQTVNVKLSLSKSTAKVGDEITVTADFKEDVEAVDQVLTYDSSKVEFIEVTTGGYLYGTNNDNTIARYQMQCKLVYKKKEMK